MADSMVHPPSWQWQWRRSDVAYTLVVAVFAALLASWFIQSNAVAPAFYQSEFGPAVLHACDRGFVNLAPKLQAPELAEFLTVSRQTFSCALLPETVQQVAPNFFQAASKYLMMSAALVWRVLGVSWGALIPLYALFYAVACVAGYGILRLVSGARISLLFALFFACLPLHLTNLPHLRDYAKAPFILMAILVLAWLMVYRFDRKNFWIFAAALGLVLGVGLGFRMDLLLFVPMVPVVQLFLTRGEGNLSIRARFAGVLLFLLIFGVSALPILRALGGGGNMFHVILLGLMVPFDQPLGIAASPAYEFGYRYNDIYLGSLVQGSSVLRGEAGALMIFGTSAYDKSGRELYQVILANFPADILIRFVAAAIKMLQLDMSGFPQAALRWLPFAPTFAPTFSLVAAGAFFVGLSLKNLKLLLVVAGAVLFLSAFPSLQFHPRHYFYLQILPLGFIAAVAAWGVGLFAPRWDSMDTHRLWRGAVPGSFVVSFRKGVGRLTVAFALGVVGLILIRAYQAHVVAKLIDQIERLPRGPSLKAGQVPNADGSLRLLAPTFERALEGAQPRLGYWRLDWGGPDCVVRHLPLRIAYQAGDPFNDHTRAVLLSQEDAVAYIFHTVELGGLNRFAGVDIDPEHLSCIQRFSALEGIASLPLFPNLRLGPNWRTGPLYQTLGTGSALVRRGAPGVTQAVFPAGAELPPTAAKDLLDKASGPVAQHLWRTFDDTVVWEGDGVLVRGKVPTPYSYVLQSGATPVDGDAYAVVSGEVFDGGLTVGLIANGQWAAQFNFDQIGKFRFFFKPPAGTYQLTVAHNVPDRPINHFRLDLLSWVTGAMAAEAKQGVKNGK